MPPPSFLTAVLASLAVATAPPPPEEAAARVLARLVAAAELREASAVGPGGEADLAAARRGQEEALEDLRPLVRDYPEDPAVLRALAVYYGLDGRPEQVARVTASAPTQDPWLDFAAMAAEARGLPLRDRGPVLLPFIASHPGMTPPRMSLARARLARGDLDAALAALDDLLLVDPDHEGAKQLKASLLAPPAVAPIRPTVPSGPPPRGAPGYLPRKPESGPG